MRTARGTLVTLFILLVLPACSSSSGNAGEASSDFVRAFSWTGESSNLLGSEQSFEKDSDSFLKHTVWLAVEDWTGRTRMAFMHRPFGVSVVLCFQQSLPHQGSMVFHTGQDELEAWLFRDGRLDGERGRQVDVLEFIGLDSQQRSTDARAIMLRGSVRVICSRGTVDALELDLESATPVPLLRSYFGASNTKEWWDARIGAPDTLRARVQGVFKASWRDLDWKLPI